MFEPPPQSDSIPIWKQWVFRYYRYIGEAIDIDSQNVTIQGELRIQAKTPSSASDTGTTGTIAYDSSYLYICTATDTWRRVAHSTW